MRSVITLLVLLCFTASAYAAELTDPQYTLAELEDRWQTRIQSMLDQGKLPKIDMETSIQPEQITDYIPGVFETMDDLGVALFAADGYQAPKDGSDGYRWSNDIRELVNKYPDRFIPTANGGTNPNWLKEKGGAKKHFIDQMEGYVRAGVYAHMGELEFRHYMSSSQCRKKRLDRDIDIPINNENGHRLFQLSERTGVPFVVHLEAEDVALDGLEEMLKAYPKAKVIVAHFAQIRHPEKQKRFTPDYVRHLLSSYANLYYDLATGHPNRKYTCTGKDNKAMLIGDTVLWKGDEGKQTDTVRPEWRAILGDFSDHFVFATDYGGGRPPLAIFLKQKVDNFKRIVRDLPEPAKHNIAYRNAWKLLTNKDWK
ncbi:MAG: amidohydrolase family protein [Rhodospirillales bacterium]|nr:amidohydrolase family protein [Rhodospirillales bacterium]